MDISLYQLRSFRIVARLRSFTKAAQRLGYSQSSVTSHIRALETRLGVRLFQRLPRGVRLTPAGETFQEYVDRIFAVIDEMTGALRPDGAISGKLTLGVSSTLIDYSLGRLVRECQLGLPQLYISPRTLTSADVANAVAFGTVDLGIVLTTETGQDEQHMWDSTLNLASQVLFPAEFVPVGSGRPESAVGPAYESHTDSEYGERVVVIDPTCPSQRVLPEILRRRDDRPPKVVETGSVESALDAVRFGLGTAMVPASALQRQDSAGDLVVLPDLPSVRFSVRMLWAKQGGLSRLAKALLELLQQTAASRTPHQSPDNDRRRELASVH
ncbi:MAG TPA: LysR family transcriptional regulator [Micromonosporaceae bacterium]